MNFKTPTNSAEAIAILQMLEEDLILLKDGDWIPDDASCDASLEAVKAVASYLKSLP